MNNNLDESIIEKINLVLRLHSIYCISKIVFYVLLLIFIIVLCCEIHDIVNAINHFTYHTYGCCDFMR